VIHGYAAIPLMTMLQKKINKYRNYVEFLLSL